MRVDARGGALVPEETGAGGSVLGLLNRSVARLPIRASEATAGRDVGTMDALLAEGIAAGMPDARGVSSHCPDLFVAGLRSAAAPLRTNLAVLREGDGG